MRCGTSAPNQRALLTSANARPALGFCAHDEAPEQPMNPAALTFARFGLPERIG